MQEKLTLEEQNILLRLAREAMERGVKGEALSPLDLVSLPARLREEGSSFITLTSGGQVRGCIGALDSYRPLAEDVREHAVAAALTGRVRGTIVAVVSGGNIDLSTFASLVGACDHG